MREGSGSQSRGTPPSSAGGSWGWMQSCRMRGRAPKKEQGGHPGGRIPRMLEPQNDGELRCSRGVAAPAQEQAPGYTCRSADLSH